MDDVEVDDAISALASDATAPQDAVIQLSTPREASYDSVPALHSYQIKPTLEEKFRANPVREIIRTVLARTLTGKHYDSNEAKNWCINISNIINKKVKALKMQRYKHVVQVIIYELKGAGIKAGVRCLWDSETDGYTTDTFKNETMLAIVVVFAVYLY